MKKVTFFLLAMGFYSGIKGGADTSTATAGSNPTQQAPKVTETIIATQIAATTPIPQTAKPEKQPKFILTVKNNSNGNIGFEPLGRRVTPIVIYKGAQGSVTKPIDIDKFTQFYWYPHPGGVPTYRLQFINGFVLDKNHTFVINPEGYFESTIPGYPQGRAEIQ